MTPKDIDAILSHAGAESAVDPTVVERAKRSILETLQPVRPLPPSWMIAAGLLTVLAGRFNCRRREPGRLRRSKAECHGSRGDFHGPRRGGMFCRDRKRPRDASGQVDAGSAAGCSG